MDETGYLNEKSKQFLFDLLSTPSPSGWETDIQKKWMAYVQTFADQVRTDAAGNVYGILNPDAKFKVLLAGHCDEIGFMVSRIDEQGYIYVSKLGGISPKPAIGMKVEILGSGKRVIGMIGANAEHHGGVKDDLQIEDLHIDTGAKSKEEIARFVKIGDPVVYKRDVELLLNDRISGRGLDNRTGAFIVAEVLRNVAQVSGIWSRKSHCSAK
jgi:endoglucanase